MATLSSSQSLKRSSGRFAIIFMMMSPRVFGQVKHCMGFRQFSMRGQEACEAEWSQVCAAHNLLKLFRHGASAMARQAQRCADLGQQSSAMALAK